ncbi:hypothetical protein [Microbispora triticiradicis]|uniref:hypothetical protein n=1 Tax=Microbispora triticiradicis TaxID=2200763 RepID=UPI001AD71CD6|nr:hypothetical protein [Microbispora triticiradicis]MBO4272719.1 hypothetical protein [Microbispora triticiradicis]
MAEEGPLFRTASGKAFSGSAVSKVWKEARGYTFSSEMVASPLAARRYALRHAAVSLWLNAGSMHRKPRSGPGHGVGVMRRVYAKCIEGQREMANRRILEALAVRGT